MFRWGWESARRLAVGRTQPKKFMVNISLGWMWATIFSNQSNKYLSFGKMKSFCWNLPCFLLQKTKDSLQNTYPFLKTPTIRISEMSKLLGAALPLPFSLEPSGCQKSIKNQRSWQPLKSWGVGLMLHESHSREGSGFLREKIGFLRQRTLHWVEK